MHSKFLVRDADTAAATVWTESANFTDDAWTLQENNILRIRSKQVAAAYTADFEEMWEARSISAENQLRLTSSSFAGRCASQIATLAATYATT